MIEQSVNSKKYNENENKKDLNEEETKQIEQRTSNRLKHQILDALSRYLDYNLYISALTALAMKDDMRKCFESGMNDYLTKPLNLKTLNSFFHNFRKRRRSTAK